MLDPGHLVDRLFDPLGELALDRFRAGTGIGGNDRDQRELDVGEHFHRQAAIGEDAQHHQSQDHDRGEDGAFDGCVGEDHSASLI